MWLFLNTTHIFTNFVSIPNYSQVTFCFIVLIITPYILSSNYKISEWLFSSSPLNYPLIINIHHLLALKSRFSKQVCVFALFHITVMLGIDSFLFTEFKQKLNME